MFFSKKILRTEAQMRLHIWTMCKMLYNPKLHYQIFIWTNSTKKFMKIVQKFWSFESQVAAYWNLPPPNVTLVLPSFSKSYFTSCQVLAYFNKNPVKKSCQESRLRSFNDTKTCLKTGQKLLWVALSSKKLSWLETFLP